MFHENTGKEDNNTSDSSSKLSIPSISLPKGGGAIRGIGEKLAANPVTGTGSMTVPIATSPGRSGFGPQLSLSYDSGSGNGPFGIGWNLSLPCITRKTDKGLPRYDDANESDIFILSGAEDLVPVFKTDADGKLIPDNKGSFLFDEFPRDGFLVRRYCPRIEGLFARIERWTNRSDPGDIRWRSISKDNIITWYGKTAQSRIADPADITRIFSWLICESYDDKGNAIVYDYAEENSDGVDQSQANERNRIRGANRYLKRINYGNRISRLRPADFAADPGWLFEVVFDYGEGHYHVISAPGEEPVRVTSNPTVDGQWPARTDPFSSCRSGFDVRTCRLCRRVLMFHHFEAELGTPDYLVLSTEFSYNENPIGSFMTGVSQSGYVLKADDSYFRKSMPPLDFEYSKATINDEVKEIDSASLENLPTGLDGSQYQWVDLDGEGLSGILSEQGDAWFYKPNMGEGKFGPLQRVPTIPSLADLKRGGVQLLDLAGDGQLDLVAFRGPVPGFYERTGDEGWEPFRTFSSLPNIPWDDPNLRFVDLTGDGHADILITEDDVFTWYPSLAEDGFNRDERTYQVFDEEKGPCLVFADGAQSVYLGDLSGDGLSDLVRIRNGEVCYWPNLGYGRFGAKVTMDNSPWFDAPDLFDQKRIRLADIDGSGTTDIIYLSGKGVAVYRNECGNGWSPPEYLSSFPSTDDISSIVATDLLGNGTACLVWSSPLPGNARSPMRYIDLMGGQKPHLLIRSNNNLGAETVVQYAPSTKFYLQDKQDGKPWITRLPFPVHCVEKVKVTDKWRDTEFATTYSYHHGYYDGIEREFRGFGRVEQIDVESFDKFAAGNIISPYITDDQTLYQPPVKTVTWYHTGVFIDRQKILSHFSEEYFSLPGFNEHVLPDPDLGAVDLTVEEWREALRACKGMMLRQEVYELDVDALQNNEQRPVKLFTTAFNNCDIKQLQPKGFNPHAVFHVTECEAITYHYELDLRQSAINPDPRVSHTLNLKIDEYGNVLESATAVYPRINQSEDSSLTAEQIDLIRQVQNQERHLALNCNQFTKDVTETDVYRLRMPCQTQAWEVTGIDPTERYFTLKELQGKDLTGSGVQEISYHIIPNQTTPQKRLVECARTLFFDDDLKSALPFGNQSAHGLPRESYKLALTMELLQGVFSDTVKLDTALAALSEIAPDGFPKSGYHKGDQIFPDDPVTPAPLGEQWWIASGIAGYSDNAGLNFYLPDKYTDPFGNITTLVYDNNYHLYIQSATDPAGNTVSVEQFDFRVLQSRRMKDINDNLSEAYFDILGMPTAMALKGKGDEADSLDAFDDVIANPDTDTLIKFFTGDYGEDEARQLLGNATARHLYYFGDKREADGSISWNAHPSCACGILREKHVTRLAEGEETPLQAAFEYSDGMGAALVKKGQAEPEEGSTARRWIASGKTILNNKGKPVKQYEPYFTDNHRFEEAAESGVTPVMYYDAAGRLVRTEMPDGSFRRVEFSPWHVTSYDPNDTVLEPDNGWYARMTSGTATAEEQRAAALSTVHAATPSVTILDSLGRDVIKIAHNKYKDRDGKLIEEKSLTFSKLDTEGKPLWIRDARGNLVMQYISPVKADNDPGNDVPAGSITCYDIAGNLLFQHSMDVGDRWMLNDAAGKPMFGWQDNNPTDESGTAVDENHVFWMAYDNLHRPLEHWLTVNTDTPQLIEQFHYGESISNVNDAHKRNMRGQLYQHYDQSGLKTVAGFDFKGNPLELQRQLASSCKAPVIGWQDGSTTAGLEGETFMQITEYDALNRTSRLFNWHKGAGSRVAVYEPAYNRRGLLESEQLVVRAVKTADTIGYTENAGTRRTTPIEVITYNAKGQREKAKYGNNTITRYQYDPMTFRLGQLRTTRPGYDPVFPGNLSPLNDDKVLQDLYYTYDPVGNITEIRDDAYETAFFKNQMVEPRSQYVYDALYRLIAATGRENVNPGNDAPGQFEPDPFPTQFPVDSQALRNYSQYYGYDSAGNVSEIRHAANGGGWTRSYGYADASNRLSRTWLGGDTVNAVQYVHDKRGNMLNLANVGPEYFMRWDYRNMIQSINLGGGGRVHYNYDSAKERTRKVNENQAGTKQWERIYLGGLEIYRKYNGSDIVEEIETVHLIDGDHRLLLVEDVLRTDNDRLETGPLYRYQYSNHLGSAVLELNAGAGIISYEEYHPYGTSAYRAVNSDIKAAAKRYRYTGMERDEESGLNYHGARYYAAWLGRWTSADPAWLADSINMYVYVNNRPTYFTDESGHNGQAAMEAGRAWETQIFDMVKNKVPAVRNVTVYATIDGKKVESVVDQLVKTAEGWTVLESKLSPKTRLSDAQKKLLEHIQKGGNFRIAATDAKKIEELRSVLKLSSGATLSAHDYKIINQGNASNVLSELKVIAADQRTLLLKSGSLLTVSKEESNAIMKIAMTGNGKNQIEIEAAVEIYKKSTLEKLATKVVGAEKPSAKIATKATATVAKGVTEAETLNNVGAGPLNEYGTLTQEQPENAAAVEGGSKSTLDLFKKSSAILAGEEGAGTSTGTQRPSRMQAPKKEEGLLCRWFGWFCNDEAIKQAGPKKRQLRVFKEPEH